MAQNTESSRTGIVPYRSPFGQDVPIRGFPESTVQTFLARQLVQLSTTPATASHRITAASSLSTSYLGVAMDAASSVQNRVIPVAMAYSDVEFRGWVKEVIASTMMGQFRSIARDTTRAIDYLATNSTEGDLRVQITEIGSDSQAAQPGDLLAAIGDTNGYVAFRFLPEFTAFGKST